jgi:hypothetical protein
MSKKSSVHGLANIGQLLNRADLPPAAPPATRERRTQDEIYQRTHEKIVASIEGNERCSAAAILGHYLKAALRDAYNSGHADALEQNSAVERLLEQQYEARTKLTMPAVVAAVMEQRGLSSMTLDLAHMATVFSRNRIEFTVSGEDVIEYTLTVIE